MTTANPDDGVAPSAPDRPRELSPPQRVTPLALTGLAIVAAAGAASTWALVAFREFAGRSAVVVTVVAVLAVACWLPLLPIALAFLQARRRARLLADKKIVPARLVATVGRDSAYTGMGYALAVVVVATLIAFAIANDGAVAHTFLEPEFIALSWFDVLQALWVNIRVAVGAEILVLGFGLLVAVFRLAPGRAGRPLRLLAILYVDVFRAIPAIVVLYLVGFGFSLAKVPVIEKLSPIWLAIFALTLTYGAYVAEVYRAGLEAIHPSQWAAARSLGLSYGMTLRTVIIPQAFRKVVPPLLNDFIGLQKDTALIGVMGVVDTFLQARLIGSEHFNLSPVIVVAIVFVVITIPQARFVDRLVARDQARQRRSG